MNAHAFCSNHTDKVLCDPVVIGQFRMERATGKLSGVRYDNSAFVFAQDFSAWTGRENVGSADKDGIKRCIQSD
ncbi:hypothetical protein BB776_04500 [Planococcus salinarum]|uniref:Uncharacterized protein n=1 Tax=Planococcus salinarum TaxID=622695 RepID=A0ABX3CU77_9BACL|nr:hypothetical protein BB776_04500 [Planococcus salinarum]